MPTPSQVEQEITGTCDARCPVLAAHVAGKNGGPEAEAHALRLACIDLMHKLGKARARMRALGHDPDAPLHPHDLEGHA